jgi:hypothetical protein
MFRYLGQQLEFGRRRTIETAAPRAHPEFTLSLRVSSTLTAQSSKFGLTILSVAKATKMGERPWMKKAY